MAHLTQPHSLQVHMTNVPANLSDRSLKIQLSTPLEQLCIRDYIVLKLRDKAFATLIFLKSKDARKFLDKYGERPVPGAFLPNGKPRMKARLNILGDQVFCRESDKKPDQVLLRVLERGAEERIAEERNRLNGYVEEPRVHKHVVFEAQGLLCGHYDYPQGILEYTTDVQWHMPGLAKFARDVLILSFRLNAGPVRVEIPYRTIHEIVASSRHSSLFLTLCEPPRVFQVTEQDTGYSLASHMRGLSVFGPSRPKPNVRKRLSEIPDGRGLSTHSDVLGQSLIYRVLVSPEEFTSKVEQLKKNDYLSVSYHNVSISTNGGKLMLDQLHDFDSLLLKCSTTIPFDILYQFQALVRNGYLLPRIVKTLLLWLQAKKAESGASLTQLPFSAHAMKKLFSQIPFPGPYTEASMFDPNEIWSLLEANEKELQQGLYKELLSERARQNLTMVYKVQVTPTRILFNGPEPEAKNRILRKFPRHIGYFARIQFSDEDGQDLHYNPKVSLQEIYARFKKILLKGFSIAGRQYGFLGFSHSSLRSHAVWFMATFVDDDKKLRSYATVILELGDFRGAARIGQAFSETPIAVDLKALNTRIEFIPDVKSKDGSRVFSDGVGTISRELVEAIQGNMAQRSKTATCFQIRWAGAKGMVSLDDTLKGNVMRVRDSMTKFSSNDDQNLEICDVANKPIPLVLNRQMIKILEDMRVPESWFFEAQNKELSRLRKITAFTNNTVVFLKRQKVAEQMGFSQFIRRLYKLGFDYKKDRFLCSVVEAVVLREVRLLKHKSRIPVEHGVTLFGIMDEFKFLDDEEVFITFDQQKGAPYPDLHNRLVIITRSPALHPGDIQIRRAIVPPESHPLRSLSNCIVFSQTGDRDLPSQLSGGDLDGDIYNVIWDPIAVDGCEFEFKPADYPRVSPLDIGRAVEAKDMTNFFVDFMATDQLGLIANRHVILADLHDAGTAHDECKLLAEMHSTAVDYSKTGVPVNMERLSSIKRSRYRPDFLAPVPPTNIVAKGEIRFEAPIGPSPEEDEDDDTGPNHLFYRSDKVLGKLYRAIDEKKIWRNDIQLVVNRSEPSLWDQLFVFIKRECEDKLGHVDWRSALSEAHNIREAYEDELWSATINYSEHASKGITELEVFTGAIFNKTGIQTRRQRDTSIRLKDEFDRIAKWVEGLIRKKNLSTDLQSDAEDDSQDGYYYADTDMGTESMALELSIACLCAGMIRVHNHANNNRNPGGFESFKVIAAHCALRELEIAIKQRDIAEGAGVLGGGFPGVTNGRA
ncbi:RdRP-domain-containing protein [Xylaria nigripes]|nr:RdRP-domain-containing protein [Xylaria nigripes]